MANFMGIFGGKFRQKSIGFAKNLTSVFSVFLSEIIICSFNNTIENEPMAKLLISWLVPSFSQHNLRPVVLGQCSLVSVTKF